MGLRIELDVESREIFLGMKVERRARNLGLIIELDGELDGEGREIRTLCFRKFWGSA